MEPARVASHDPDVRTSYADVVVSVMWDGEAEVYVATSDDVPGFVTEAATWDALREKVRILVPELVELNGPASLARVPKLDVLMREYSPADLPAE